MVLLALLTTLCFLFLPVNAFHRRTYTHNHLVPVNRDLKQATRSSIVDRQEMLRRGDLRPRGTMTSYPYCPGFSADSGVFSHAVYNNNQLDLEFDSQSRKESFQDCLASCCLNPSTSRLSRCSRQITTDDCVACSALAFAPDLAEAPNCFLYYGRSPDSFSYDTGAPFQLVINRQSCADNAANGAYKTAHLYLSTRKLICIQRAIRGAVATHLITLLDP